MSGTGVGHDAEHGCLTPDVRTSQQYAQRMTEAVIVATARSPIGRAAKGSLVDLRPDDMSAQIVKALMAKVPQVPAGDDRGPDHGLRPARRRGRVQHRPRRADPRRARRRPGVTVNRYCSSSLQTIRMAAHAIKAGEGDCFIAAGVEAVSRYGAGRQRHRAERDLQPARRAHAPSARPGRRRRRGRRPTGLPDIYIAMGQTAENVVQSRGRHAPGDGRVRRALAGPRRGQRRERLLRATRSRR